MSNWFAISISCKMHLHSSIAVAGDICDFILHGSAAFFVGSDCQPDVVDSSREKQYMFGCNLMTPGGSGIHRTCGPGVRR